MGLFTKKSAGLVWGLSGPSLMWALDKLGVPIPTPIIWVVIVASLAGLCVSAGVYLKHAHEVWVRPIPHRHLKAVAQAGVGILSICLIAFPVYVLMVVGSVEKQPPQRVQQPLARPAVEQPKPPDRNGVAPLISVEGVTGLDLDGQILIGNQTSRDVTLLAYRYDTFGGYLNSHAGPETIPAYRTYPISIDPDNKLIKTGRLDLRYDFKFAGDDTVYKNKASFIIPAKPKIGGQIGTNECCDADDAPELGNKKGDIDGELLQPRGHVAFSVNDADGFVTYGRIPFQTVVFDPEARLVAFVSGPESNQIARVAAINRVPTGDHWIAALWDVRKKRYELSADGHPGRHVTKAEMERARRERHSQQPAL